jgi:hypothetical protein
MPTPNIWITDETEMSVWTVVVGNIGTVYTGEEETIARSVYDTYVHMSERGEGRCAYEEVSLFFNEECIETFIPTYIDSED